MFNNKKINDIIIYSILFYIMSPIIIFSYYWYNPIITIIGVIIFLYSVWKCKSNLTLNNPFDIKEKGKEINKLLFWIISIILISVWIYFSGIGNYSFQSDDFWVRSPIYYDLCNKEWPLIYDLSKNTDYVQSLIGNDKVFFVYYLSYWLVPAFISKIFNLNTNISDFILYTYTIIGILSVLYLICLLFNRIRYKYLLFLLFFSGMDVVEYIISTGRFPTFFRHMETSSHFFQIAGNTVQVYWVFNQSIPIWIIVCLFLLVPVELCGGVAALSFAYSPFATFGFIPLVIYRLYIDTNIRNNIKYGIKKIFTIGNMGIALFMLFTYGLYYSMSKNSQHGLRPTTDFLQTLQIPLPLPIALLMYILFYIIFIYMEVMLYSLCMRGSTKDKCNKWKYMKIVMVELLIFPLIYIQSFNFPLRGIVPAYFLFMLLILRYFTECENKRLYDSKTKRQKLYHKILIILLLIGSISSFYEIGRSINGTFNGDKEKQKGFISFDYMDKKFIPYEEEDDIPLYEYIMRADMQFFIHNYEQKLYIKIKG